MGSSFAFLDEEPNIRLPRDYMDQVREDLLKGICSIVFTASIVRDLYTDAALLDDEDEYLARGGAFVAETLLTLRQMASDEDVTLDIGDRALVFNEFPEGLGSLPEELNYPTPSYFNPTMN